MKQDDRVRARLKYHLLRMRQLVAGGLDTRSASKAAYQEVLSMPMVSITAAVKEMSA